ncbi:MAG: histidinol dehydrogenase [Chlorobi bacterium]|nr:histidinol dehydrogenase [Chlorobiota bacterium]
MKIVEYPLKSQWDSLFSRPVFSQVPLEKTVRRIFRAVASEGDKAVLRFGKEFDRYSGTRLEVSSAAWNEQVCNVDSDLKAAIDRAAVNIRRFHEAQLRHEKKIETEPGVICRREIRPIDRVGLYIPGGSAPLFSTVLMLGIPASVAGCRELYVCTPPDQDGKVRPEILYAAKVAGIQRIFRAGGIQAIAAMNYGTESIPPADKIFGPGNQYVTAAKQYAQYLGTAIDLPAGPSEVLVIADETARPRWLAADLLSQAEHGPDSQVILITWNKELIRYVQTEIEDLLPQIPRREIARKALQHARMILCRDAGEAVAMANAYAPEHLILAVIDPERLLNNIRHAGSVFLGHFTPESAGDYASGTNHTLPTRGFARVYGGVSTENFIKMMTIQEISRDGLKSLGPVIETMAGAEKLIAHKLAVSVRLENENTSG